MEILIERKSKTNDTPNIQERKSVAVIGSGLVGRCWAIVFARAGTLFIFELCDTIFLIASSTFAFRINTVKDTMLTFLMCSLKSHKKRCRTFVKLQPIFTGFSHYTTTLLNALSIGLLRQCKRPEEIVERITIVSELKTALNGVIWAQECVPENVEHKKKIFEEMDQLASKEVILASSSSAIPCSKFTSHLNGKGRCIVAHPVNPPHIIPLVELVPSPFTEEWVTTKARSFMSEIGQSPIVAKKEIDSFILNRLQGAVLNEAWKLVEEGYISPEDLDTTMKDGLGLRWSFMGPFETIDLNAPGGVKDYVERYGGNMYELAKQQATARPWQGAVVDEVVNARRNALPLEKLQERAKWRDRRLMELMAHKLRLDREDKLNQ